VSKIKRTDRITKNEVFQRAKEERLLLIDATNEMGIYVIKHKEILGNILEGVISGRKGLGKTSNTIRKASH
jgi:hypothetical protein